MWMIHIIFSKVLDLLFPPLCYGCKKEKTIFCNSCLLHTKKPLSSPYPFITSLYAFKTPSIRKAIHAIKYFHRKDLLIPFARKIAEEIRSQNISGTLVPIPMHPIRRMLRGYNQAEELAKLISYETSLPCDPKLLIKKKYSKKQVGTSSRHERLKNQHNAFHATHDITRQTIILIDDVTTTGATLHEARKDLITHGAKAVWAFTIAH